MQTEETQCCRDAARLSDPFHTGELSVTGASKRPPFLYPGSTPNGDHHWRTVTTTGD